MRKLVVVILLLAFSLSVPFVAKGYDGDSRRVKKRKVVRKTASVKAVPATPREVSPVVEFFIQADTNQLVANVYGKQLWTESSVYTDGKLIPINSDLKQDTFKDQKNQIVVETFLKQFNPEKAAFNAKTKDRQSTAISTMAMNRPGSQWTQEDVEKIRQMFTEFYAPMQVSFVPLYVSAKGMVLPQILDSAAANPGLGIQKAPSTIKP